ncbi:hypothetical protein MHYP_G00183460 [Metynnis hypsauchen]
MKVSVVLLLFCLSSVHLQRAADHLAVGDEQDEQIEFTQSQIEELEKQDTGLEGSADSTELSAEAPGEENSNTPKVAFSYASDLNGILNAESTGFILVFRKKITDVGNTYNTITGVFTAPISGVYYFRFNLLGCSSSQGVFAGLNKNKEQILFVTEKPRGSCETVVGGAPVLLKKGDHVYVVLRSKSQIYDNSNNYCTFSGFLLFPM